MQRFFLLVPIVLLIAGCVRTMRVHEDLEHHGQDGSRALQTRFEKATAEDWFQIVLHDGTIIEGTYFSIREGVVTLRMGDSFREAELTEIDRIRYRTTEQTMRFWVYPLAGLAIAFIFYSFTQE